MQNWIKIHMISFLQLIRFKNLFIIIVLHLLIKFALFDAFEIETKLSYFAFFLLTTATVCLAAAGYIINDIQDVIIDKINKPQRVIVTKTISEKKAFLGFVFLNILGIAIGFYLSNSIDKPGFAALFIALSILLYLYSTYLKGVALIGNMVVAILVAMSILIVPLFDLYPVINENNKIALSTIFSLLIDYAIFAFLITLIREIVKDLEDYEGDKSNGLLTLPIWLGKKASVYITIGLTVITIVVLVMYLYTYLFHQLVLMLYFLIFIIAPLLYLCIVIAQAKHKKTFRFISMMLKLILCFGLASLALYPILLL